MKTLDANIYKGLACLDFQVFESRPCRSDMGSKHELVALDKHNYGMWAVDMETLLKSKALLHFTKTVVLDPKDEH
jgi:hypothetical protein